MEMPHVTHVVPLFMNNHVLGLVSQALSNMERATISVCIHHIIRALHFTLLTSPAQRAINHPTLDKSGRVRLNIPSEFDLNDLLSFLGERQGKFNIRATQAWGSLYVLDLGETYKFLRSLSEYNGNSRSNFLEFIDRRIIESKDKSKNWLTCIKDCDPMRNIYVSSAKGLSFFFFYPCL